VVFYCVAGSIVVMGRTDKTKMGNRKGAAAQTQGGKRMRVLGAFNTAARSAEDVSTCSSSAEAPEAPTSDVNVSQLTMDDSFDSPLELASCVSSTCTRITHGRDGVEFVEGEWDWRSFGRLTYQGWVECGWVEMVREKIRAYHKATSRLRAQKVLVFESELPLSYRGECGLSNRVHAVSQLLGELARMYGAGESLNQVTAVTDRLSVGGQHSATIVRQWTLQFLRDGGKFKNVGYSKRTSRSIIWDPVARAEMTTWISTASRAHPPATAQDFANFVNTKYNCNIKKRSAQIWLGCLGFRYKTATSLEVYNDGHQREDVLAALKIYVRDMLELQRATVTYTGEYMNTEVQGELLPYGQATRHIISYHDECCCHASDRVTKRWSMPGKGGCMKDKSRGAARMVAAYICAEVGVWRESVRVINPGKNKDGWWDGEQTQAQAHDHLLEFDRWCSTHMINAVCTDIYDNSANHDCMAKDGLDVYKEGVNLGIGGDGVKVLCMRKGAYVISTGESVEHSYFLAAADILHVSVKKGHKCLQQLPAGVTKVQLTADHPIGEVLGPDSELIGVKKGVQQYLKERGVGYKDGKCEQQKHRDDASKTRKQALKAWKLNPKDDVLLLSLLSLPLAAHVLDFARQLPCNCAKCTLAEQWDFKSQKSGLEEVYMRHNQVHGTQHMCRFLPKFHPELNPIERVWSRMKLYTRKYNTGKLDDLARHMTEGLAEGNLPVALVRKYIRLVTAYYMAYRDNMDIVEADKWIRKHRSHRGHSNKMDSGLEQLYFPLGRLHVDQIPEEEEAVPAVEDRDRDHECEDDWDNLVEHMGDELFTARDIEMLSEFDRSSTPK
jgi:transposase